MAQLRVQGTVTNRDIVSELILKSILASGVAEQRLIVQKNRPQPKPWKSFSSSVVWEKDWLCGIEVSLGLFCRPCLLFKSGVSST